MDYTVVSDQDEPYSELERVITRHLTHEFQRPIAESQQQAFKQALDIIQDFGGPVILDAGCGTGLSSLNIAQTHPEHLVIGLDKSSHRLGKSKAHANVHFIQANLIDFYLQANRAKLKFAKHYLLYPNPWPKAKHFGRRFHGHPIFPALLSLSDAIELRSNWQIYLQEFAKAAKLSGSWQGNVHTFVPTDAISLFEQKYINSNQTVYRLCLSADFQ